MDYKDFIKMYWSQYCLYEKEFMDTSDYVMIDRNNYATFSNQYLKLFVAICSEIDSISMIIAKYVCEEITTYSNIIKKIAYIKTIEPNLNNIRVTTKFPITDEINIVPFCNFDEEKVAPWWQVYNSVKHARTDESSEGRANYMSANLMNVLNAISALYILNCVLYERIDDDKKPELNSQIFKLP